MTKTFVTTLIAGLLIAAPGFAAKRDRSPEGMFKQLDKNADGKVDATEFGARRKAADNDKQKANKGFSRMDRNADGVVTLDEFKAAREKAGSKRKK